jgi:hypothetical protein
VHQRGQRPGSYRSRCAGPPLGGGIRIEALHADERGSHPRIMKAK